MEKNGGGWRVEGGEWRVERKVWRVERREWRVETGVGLEELHNVLISSHNFTEC